MRRKNFQVADVETHQHRKNLDFETREYIDARNSGMQPQSTQLRDVQMAREVTDKTGVPFRADIA